MPIETLRQTRDPTLKSISEPESVPCSTVLVPVSLYSGNVAESFSEPDVDSNPTLKLKYPRSIHGWPICADASCAVTATRTRTARQTPLRCMKSLHISESS